MRIDYQFGKFTLGGILVLYVSGGHIRGPRTPHHKGNILFSKKI